MLIAGEDLGMVPASVPGVMRQLGMLGLNIQRMPSNPETEFGHPDHAPYLSVVTTSSHDMSTIRGWWEEDRVRTQRFYETMLGHWRQVAPFYCEPWVAREIIGQHLHSPAMWAIFPAPGFAGHGLRPAPRQSAPGANQRAQQPPALLEVPPAPALEELIDAPGFNEPLRDMVQASGR